MLKKTLLISSLAILTVSLIGCAPQQARTPLEKVQTTDAQLKWWRDARFGMFIHWGPVSIKGTEIGWSRGRQVPIAEYDNLYKQFDPTKFNAAEWVSTAKAAGMKYIVITSKHHDGFSLFDSKYTDYDIMSTPFKRDVIAELAAECKKQHIHFCFYYSILDWHHPDYYPRGAGDKRPTDNADLDRYFTYMKNQLTELLTNYGPIGILWFDGEWDNTWTDQRARDLYVYLKSLQPDIIINNRIGKARHGMKGTSDPNLFAGDYDTPEQQVGKFNDQRPWETCMTICKQWAYKPDDTMKSLKQCMDTLIRTVGGDGNLLFNVGPMPDGRIEPRQVDRLKEMGHWLTQYGQTIYKTRGGPFKPGNWGVSTCHSKTVYLHILDWPADKLTLPPIDAKIKKASLLTGGSVDFKQTTAGLEITVPAENRRQIDTIVELRLDRSAEKIPPIETTANDAKSKK